MFNHIGRLRKQIIVKDQVSKAVAEDNKALRAALDASETKRKAVEAAMEKKEREFNERASIRALVARMLARRMPPHAATPPLLGWSGRKPGATESA